MHCSVRLYNNTLVVFSTEYCAFSQHAVFCYLERSIICSVNEPQCDVHVSNIKGIYMHSVRCITYTCSLQPLKYGFTGIYFKYRLLYPRECDIRYTCTEPEGRRHKGEVRVYRILHEGGCNNVFISAEAILCMYNMLLCNVTVLFEIKMRSKQAPVSIESWSEWH